MKRLLSVLLALALVLSCVPVAVFAEEAAEEETYIEVRTVEDLYNIRNDLTANYILMNDIDLTAATAEGGDWDFDGRGWNPIGSDDVYDGNAFSGIFDGNGYSIKGLRINLTNNNKPSGIVKETYIGLFANVAGTVRDLHIVDTNINVTYYSSFGSPSNSHRIGAIAGFAGSTARIENCSVTGKVTGDIQSSSSAYYYHNAGGLIGENQGNVNGCYNAACITAQKAGGIAAGIGDTGIVQNCYNIGNIYGYGYAGGIVGSTSSKAKVINCYNRGLVKSTATSSSMLYGIAGSTYSGVISNCYYLNTTGKGSTGATALTDAQMQLASVYAGFDFKNTWCINADANHPYPQLINNPQDLRVIKNAQIYTLPQKTVYELGEKFNSTGLVLEFLYENAEAEYVNITANQVTGFDASVLGTQTLAVTYHNRTFTFDVTVTEKPYKEIYTIQDLYNIRLDLTGNYILMNDIDLTEATAEDGEWDFDGRGWNPIGSNDIYTNGAFSGIFDGNGYTIKGMRINLTKQNKPSGIATVVYVGLFSNVTGSIRNLNMEDVNVTATYYDDSTRVGAIAGSVGTTATIESCSVTGNLIGYTDWNSYIGGLTGYNTGNIKKSYNCATVNGSYAGGIAGYNYTDGSIQDCYNTGNVYGEDYGGGIAGYLYSGKIVNCYSTGTIKYSPTSSSLEYGIAYKYNGTITNCYYLTDSGKNSTGATALTEAQMKIGDMFAGFDFESVWVIDPNAVHPYPQLQSNIQDMSEAVEMVRLIVYPAKLDYYTGDELALEGSLLEVIYVTGRSEFVSIIPEMITGYDPAVIGEQTLTVTVGGKTDTFAIQVTQRPEVVSATLISEPTQKEFIVGTQFDFSGAKIQVVYDNDTNEILDVTEAMTTGGDINHMGAQTITVAVGSQTVTFTVKVVPASMSSISVSKLPDKVVYAEGEDLDTTGMEITVSYSNGSQMKLTSGYTVSGFASEVGVQTVTVAFAGLTTTFTVTVNPLVLTGIEVQTMPNKLIYVEGEALDTEGLVVVAVYDGGIRKEVTGYDLYGYVSVPGNYDIYVFFDGYFTSFAVTVTAKTVADIRVTRPTKIAYALGESFDASGLVVTACYNNGDEQAVEDYTISGFNSTTPGPKVITVTYGNVSRTFMVIVENRVLTQFAAEHRYMNGDEEVAVNYVTLAEALAAANSGTIKLLEDAEVEDLILSANVTLDLNGYVLSAQRVIVMNGATLLDGGENCIGGGSLKIARNSLIYAQENNSGIIPVWNGVDGYVFTKVTFQQMARTAGTGAAQYIFLPRFSNAEAAAFLADGGADNGLKLKVGLTWNGGQCQQFYTYDDGFVAQVFASNGGLAFSLTVTGIAGITDMVASAMIVTDSYAQAAATGTALVAG